MPPSKINPVRALAGITFAGAIVGAIAFTSSLYYTLPPTDAAYHTGLWRLFLDPFVDSVAFVAALAVTVLAFPLVFLSLRRKKLERAAPLVISVPAIVIAALTPFIGGRSLVVGMLVLLGLLMFCRRNAAWDLPKE